MTIYDVIKRPIVTEKGVEKKDAESTLCFEVALDGQQDASEAGRRALVQGESGRGPDCYFRRQDAAPGTIFRLSFRLEESLCAA